ncbi:nuclear transport factor 2 family protein [Thalassococcus sp. BH17M4-6]|uniref:nuclear transport factor 2 family protein n=1 Tax=Thalassococcus sp. BH17M4-6 TaxID=3413148 RepID=UPI003BC0AE52
MSDAIRNFFAAWGMEDAALRQSTIEEVTGASFAYTDPNTPDPVATVPAFLDYIAMFTSNMPGATAEVVDVSAHHGFARATVDFMRDGATMVRGQYFADLDDSGAIIRMVGFTGTGEPA